MAGELSKPSDEHLFDAAVVQEFYKRIDERLCAAGQLPFEPYDEDEAVGLITLYALVGGSRKHRLAKADPLVSLLQGKTDNEAMAEAEENGNPIGFGSLRRLLTSGASGAATSIRQGKYTYSKKSKIRTVRDPK